MSDDVLTPPAAAVLAGLKPGDRVQVNRHGAWVDATVMPWIWGHRLLTDDGGQMCVFDGYTGYWNGRVRPVQHGEATDDHD